MNTIGSTVLLAACLVVATACNSEVVGGGGGAGGGGDGGAAATGSSGETGGGTTTGESTSHTGPATTSGGGGANALGECDSGEAVTVGGTGPGSFECSSSYTCDGGQVTVSCVDDGTTETCDCFLDGELSGSCVEQNDAGCSIPVGCCYALLGGEAQPNPGPYGSCAPTGGSTSAVTASGGETACLADYTCDGGQLAIGCSGSEAGVSCECRDGQGFLLATCEQPVVDCDYASGCCFALVN